MRVRLSRATDPRAIPSPISMPCFERRQQRGGRLLCRSAAQHCGRGSPTNSTAGIRRHVVVETILPLRCAAVARGRSNPTGTAGRTPAGRNNDWAHFNTAAIIAMPDKWEYPWFAAWDWGFHLVTPALIDPDSPRTSWSSYAALGTCIRTASSPLTSGTSVTSIRRYMPGRRCASTRSTSGRPARGPRISRACVRQAAAQLYLVGEP